MLLRIIFILTIRLRDQHVFMQQSQKILNVSNIFETNFLKIKNHFQEAGVFFLVKSTRLPRQKPVLRQMEWGVQNGPITKNGVLPSHHFFENFVSI